MTGNLFTKAKISLVSKLPSAVSSQELLAPCQMHLSILLVRPSFHAVPALPPPASSDIINRCVQTPQKR